MLKEWRPVAGLGVQAIAYFAAVRFGREPLTREQLLGAGVPEEAAAVLLEWWPELAETSLGGKYVRTVALVYTLGTLIAAQPRLPPSRPPIGDDFGKPAAPAPMATEARSS